MTVWRALLPAVLMCPSLTFAASKEIVELQRDLALLQEQVRTLQRSQDEKLSAIQVLVQQALDAAGKANTAVALLQNNLQQNSKDQQSRVVTTVTDLGSKMDSMSTDFNALRESVADIASQVGKLQQQMVDLSNTFKASQVPAAPPPGSGPGGGIGGVPGRARLPPACPDLLGNPIPERQSRPQWRQ